MCMYNVCMCVCNVCMCVHDVCICVYNICMSVCIHECSLLHVMSVYMCNMCIMSVCVCIMSVCVYQLDAWRYLLREMRRYRDRYYLFGGTFARVLYTHMSVCIYIICV